MPKYIDADALLKHAVEADRMGAMLVVGVGYILDAPTADVAEVVHGYVKCVSKSTFEQYEPSVYACSVCGTVISRDSKLCKECGARMGGSEKK